jgi:sarcosine oxidase
VAADDVECVVVGAGALGLSTAHALARRGRQVVVCEQGTVGHDGSGSKGSARIFRLGYDEPGYVRLAQVALRWWRRLESELGTTLLTTTGQVTFGPDLDVLTDALDEASAPYQRMGPGEVADRFPAMRVATVSVFEPESGVIGADTYLAALGARPGVEVRERVPVLRIEDKGSLVRVVLGPAEPGHDMAPTEIRAEVVVVCAGPWTAPLVSGTDLGLRPYPTLEQVAYLQPADRDRRGIDVMPVFVERRHPWFYGLPVLGTGLTKVSLHGGGPVVSLDDLNRFAGLDRPDGALVDELVSATRTLLPGLDPEPVATERCVYDNVPDGDFVLDRMGRVVVGSGTSGHGFKFAPLLGELLADLATGSAHHRDLGSPGDLARFAGHRLGSNEGGGGPTIHR